MSSLLSGVIQQLLSAIAMGLVSRINKVVALAATSENNLESSSGVYSSGNTDRVFE